MCALFTENLSNVLKSTAQTYTNIHNIVNPSDVVPKVAMSAWGFIRYGTDETLPSRLTNSNRELYDAMLEKFIALNTEATKESLVSDKNGHTTHVISTFQGKRWKPRLVEIGLNYHWEWKEGPFGLRWKQLVIDVDDFAIRWKPHLFQDTETEMSAFLDDLVTALALGFGNRVEYRLTMQEPVRVICAWAMSNGLEAERWDKAMKLFANEVQEHTLDIAITSTFSGGDAAVALVTGYFLSSAQEAGINGMGYSEMPVAIVEAIGAVCKAVVMSVIFSGNEDLVTLCFNGGMIFKETPQKKGSQKATNVL